MPLRFVILGTLRGLIYNLPVTSSLLSHWQAFWISYVQNNQWTKRWWRLMYVLQTHLLRMRCKVTKKTIRIKTFFVIGFVKTEILVQLCHYNDRKHQTTCQIHSAWYKKPCQRWHEMCRQGFVAWWLYNTLSEDGRNSVSCITPYGMVQEMLFLRPDPKERVRKQRARLIPWELLMKTM